jgi:phosphoribosylformylglycinamidine synthase
MALAGNIGASLDVPEHEKMPLDWLFGEDQARYVVTTADPAPIIGAAEEAGVPAAVIGRTGGAALTVTGDTPISLDELRDAHEGWLPRYMAGP